MRILVGATNLITDGEVVSVERIINHPHYRPVKPLNDISLVYLAQVLQLSETVRPIPVSKRILDYGERVLTSGWGLTEVCLHSVCNEKIGQNIVLMRISFSLHGQAA